MNQVGGGVNEIEILNKKINKLNKKILKIEHKINI